MKHCIDILIYAAVTLSFKIHVGLDSVFVPSNCADFRKYLQNVAVKRPLALWSLIFFLYIIGVASFVCLPSNLILINLLCKRYLKEKEAASSRI